MDKQVGRKIGKYEVVSEIGEGGMGVVYKARDLMIGRMVAIKTITPDLISDPEILKRFYREAQSAGILQHPNIVTIHDMGESGGCPYIVMEYVEGDSLKNIITRRHPIPLATKLKLVQQFCEGLSHAHKNGFVHRDVKPANILLTKTGTVKVVDFGIVHLNTTTLTKTGTFLGTVHYASPEQVNDGHVDSRSDLWAVACVIYELISYKKPFDGSTIAAVIAKILNTEPMSLSTLSPEIPPQFDGIISKALKKNPEERYQSLDELLADVLPLARGLQMTFIADLLGEAAVLRTKGDLDGAQEKVRDALYLDNTHGEAKRLQSEITADIQRLPAGVKAKKLVADAQQALGRGEFSAAMQALGEAQKLAPLDAHAKTMFDHATRQQKRANEQREALITGTRGADSPGPSESTSVLAASPLATPLPRPKTAGLPVSPGRKSAVATPAAVAPREVARTPSLVWMALAIAVVLLTIGGYFFFRTKSVSGPTIEESRLEAVAQGLQDAGDLQSALAKWQELAAKNGTLKDEATRAIDAIGRRLQVEKDLYDQAKNAEDEKRWDDAIALYKKVAALNGPMKDQAFNAIPIVMQLQRGMDISKIEEQTYDQADGALKRNDYSVARGLFELVISLNVSGSTLAPKAQAAVADIDQTLKSKGLFDAAERTEASGDLQGALGQYQRIASTQGPVAQEAQNRIQQITDRLSAKALQQQFDAASRDQSIGLLNSALAQFKAIAAKPGPLAQSAQTHIQQINAQLTQGVENQQFDAADRLQSSGDLNGALTQFKAIADGPGSMKSQAQARVTAINGLLAAAGKPSPDVSKSSTNSTPPARSPLAANGRAPEVAVLADAPQAWTRPVQRGSLMPNASVDGGLKATNLALAATLNAPAASSVMLMINIDENGKVTPGRILKDTSGIGAQVSEASKAWTFRPPTVKEKPVKTSVSVRVTF
jgi:hypothetical protein